MNERAIAHLTKNEREAIQEFIHQLHMRYPDELIQITLFGSKARGDSRPWSDIDVLILVTQESWSLRGGISNLAADVSLEYDVILGPRVIGQERWEHMKERRFGLYENIIAEGIPLAPERAMS